MVGNQLKSRLARYAAEWDWVYGWCSWLHAGELAVSTTCLYYQLIHSAQLRLGRTLPTALPSMDSMALTGRSFTALLLELMSGGTLISATPWLMASLEGKLSQDYLS